MHQLQILQSIGGKYIQQLESVFPYASIFAQQISGRKYFCATREKNVNFIKPECGFVMQAFNGSNFIEYASDNMCESEYEKAVTFLMQHSASVVHGEFTVDPGERLHENYKQQMKIDPVSQGDSVILRKAEDNMKLIQKQSGKIAVVYSLMAYFSRNELFINRNKNLYQELHRFDNAAQMVFSENNKSVMMYCGESRTGGFEHSDFMPEAVEKCIRSGEKILNAERMKPGVYKTVFSPEMAGIFAHEAFGHGTETDMFLKNRSKGKEYMNRQVASPLVNMYDGPCLEHAAANYFFDNEGMPASKTTVIKDGILVSGLTDLYSSAKLNIPRTSNGRREVYSHKAYARMTNTYFEKGNSSFEEMIKSIDHGFYVAHATNGMEDPKGWGIQLEALYAEEIINGRLSGKVYSPVIVTGYVPDMLMSIEAVSDDFEISSMGHCGKGHKEWVKVTDGGPYLKLKARLA